MKCKIYLIYASIVLGALMLIAGIGIMVGGDLHTRIEQKLKGITLTEGSKVFQTWKNPPPPVFMEFFFFNVTNPDEFMDGRKPSLMQIGPYTYREYRPKVNVTFVENGSKVAALTPKTFVFVPEMSAGDPSVDSITTINIPAVAVMYKLKNAGFFAKSSAAVLMTTMKTTMFMTHTVDELLWGFKDPLLSRLHSIKPEVDERFGLMLYKNGSNDGEFVYYTGEHNYLDYGRIHTWKGEKSIYMLFEKEVVVKGIPAYRYTPPRAVLASGKNNPENEGFCLEKDKCLDDGVLNVDVCRKGAPVVVSFPHFYLADEKYVKAIEGVSPVHEHHQTFLDLNPSVVIDDASAHRLHKLLFIVKLVPNFHYVLLTLGVVLLLIGLPLFIHERQKKRASKTDTSYSPATAKQEDAAEKNGTFIGMTPVEKS
ncbi:Lysosome membrane protein 2 [Bagarius yarrelli]|uniref:Lysosome membrane protein 2 n=1 Tax=Bagarius yarrelli TaxID=175774 RepID=A0A556TUA1_BAGYA|nr:Lysosome membrane protein 2 [Bagarius yarrelli]